jgi:hypothetical protein
MTRKALPAPLSMPAIPRKGEAAPAVQSFESRELESEHPRRAFARSGADTAKPAPSVFPSASRVKATIAVTVRLDVERYERLKSYSTGNRVTNQDIIVAALDRFFEALR